MIGMKIEEEFVPDRRIEVQTDDEEDEAERDCDEEDNDNDETTESDPESPSDHLRQNSGGITIGSHNNNSHDHWPQSYRQSMDLYTNMTPPSNSFLRDTSDLNPFKRSHGCIHDQSSLYKRLISSGSLDNDEVPTSTLPVKLSATTNSRASFRDLPPPVEQCSYSQSVLNAINVLCGIGLLSVPYAFKEGGWLSIVLLLVFGVVTCYTGVLLKNCLESSPGLQTYPDIGEAAFGLSGRICIATVLYIELYSSCVEYLIMMSDNLSALFPNAELDIGGIHLDSYQFCAITSTLVILPTVWLRNLSLLSYISVGGVVTLAVVVICLVWLGVVDNIGYHPSGTALDLANFPVAIGLIGFCYGSHSVFPNIYTSMKEPSRFPSVLIISFVLSCFLYTAVGVYGYLLFGDSIESQFTLNMPTEYVTSKVAAWTVAVAPVTKFALTLTPVAFGVEELLPSSGQKSYCVSILIRTGLVLSTLFVALSVPYFATVMALIGSLLVMLVALIFPCACYLSIQRSRLSTFQITLCSFTICMGVICAIFGTYSSLASIPG